MTFPYECEGQIKEIVRGFESCTTAKTDFPHRSHLTVAISYMHEATLEDATDKMRAGLFRFLAHHGVEQGKYNETVTVFWMRMVQKEMKNLKPDLSLADITNAVINALGNPRLVFDYYSVERLNSPAAKQQWIEPDLQSL